MREELLARISRVTPEEERILRGEGGIDRRLYTHSEDFIVDRTHFLRPGMQIALRPHTRFTEFPLHGHDYVEIMYVVSGTVTHIAAGDEVALGAGQLLFLGTNTRHRVLSAGREDVAFNLLLTTEFLASFLDRVRGSGVLRDFIVESLRTGGAPRYLHFDVSRIPEAQNLLENLVWSLVGETPAPQFLLQETLALLLFYLVLYPGTLVGRGEGREDRRQTSLRSAVTQYVQTDYQTASLTVLSDRLGFSPQYVSDWIRRNMGTSFVELVRDRRFDVARQLLLNTDLSVSDIVAAVGYENSSYFHRVFREKFGKTPRSFRTHSTRD